LDQESRGDCSRMAGEARTDCGVSHADRARLVVYSVIQRQARDFARATGQLAKTDALAARALAPCADVIEKIYQAPLTTKTVATLLRRSDFQARLRRSVRPSTVGAGPYFVLGIQCLSPLLCIDVVYIFPLRC
jgi:hypothetical protein